MPVNIDTCQCWHLSVFRPKLWTKTGKCFIFDEILYSKQIEGGEFNGDNSFLWFLTTVKFDTSQYWRPLSFRPYFQTRKNFNSVKFYTLHKSKSLSSTVTIVFLWFLMLVNFELCQYWHLSCFRAKIWTKNDKCFNFDETLCSAQIEGAEFNGGTVNTLSLKFRRTMRSACAIY